MWGCFVLLIFRFPRERVILMAFRKLSNRMSALQLKYQFKGYFFRMLGKGTWISRRISWKVWAARAHF